MLPERTFTGTNAFELVLSAFAPDLAPINDNVAFASASTIPIVASAYTISGSTLGLTLNYAPTPGTLLTVIQNTGGSPINGTFTNLPNGGAIMASYGGATYTFTANYAGGASGDNLVLTLTNVGNLIADDSPVLPPWGPGLMVLLLFLGAARSLSTARKA